MAPSSPSAAETWSKRSRVYAVKRHATAQVRELAVHVLAGTPDARGLTELERVDAEGDSSAGVAWLASNERDIGAVKSLA